MEQVLDHNNKLSNEYFEMFIKSGEFFFTALNTKTGVKVSFKITRGTKYPSKILIKVHDLAAKSRYPKYTKTYKYIGVIHEDNKFVWTCQTAELPWQHPKVQSFDFLWRYRQCLPAVIEIYHSKKCGRCGRKLTTPTSIKMGVGPICKKILQGHNH